MVSVWAVVPAAGRGRRFGAAIPKQYLELEGRPLLGHVLDLFLDAPGIDGLVLAVAKDDARWKTLVSEAPTRPLMVVEGGATRAASVLSALSRLKNTAEPHDWVLVHDAARPCLSGADLRVLINTLREDPVGGLLAAPVVDTLKRADEGGRVAGTQDRAGLWRALTPQMFRLDLLSRTLRDALEAGVEVTDEASAIEWAGHKPRLVSGGADNIKVTQPEDMAMAAAILRARMIKSVS